MPDAPLANPPEPFRVFISHKVSGHGEAVENIKHKLENYAPSQLHIFVSPSLSPGVKWRPEVLQEIDNADLFILLYLVEGIDLDWCLYEAGYAERTGRKLICVTNPDHALPGPLENRQRVEATEHGVEDLLRAIYADEHKPVRPDFFDVKNKEDLAALIRFVLAELQPVKRQPLCPRLWVTVSGTESLEQLKNGVLPGTARLTGEAEALRQLGVGQGEEITVADFRQRSDFHSALDFYVPHLANCLRRIIEKYPDLWILPPICVARGARPKVLVPAYVETGLADTYRFEFLLYQPEPDEEANADSAFGQLCNLFFLASVFRKRIIEDWLEVFMNLQSLGPHAKAEDVRHKVRKFKLVFGAILLEAMNRKVDSPRQVEKCFRRPEDREKLQRILNPQDGLYLTQAARLQAAMEARDLNGIIEALHQLRNINKTLLVLSAARLQELAMENEGDLI